MKNVPIIVGLTHHDPKQLYYTAATNLLTFDHYSDRNTIDKPHAFVASRSDEANLFFFFRQHYQMCLHILCQRVSNEKTKQNCLFKI